jgi:hypothetical protein
MDRCGAIMFHSVLLEVVIPPITVIGAIATVVPRFGLQHVTAENGLDTPPCSLRLRWYTYSHGESKSDSSMARHMRNRAFRREKTDARLLASRRNTLPGNRNCASLFRWRSPLLVPQHN